MIAGLGNPGRRYAHTRHNLGFLTIDMLAEKHRIKVNRIRHKSLVGEGTVAGRKVLLVKPQTYMNLSGEAIREALLYYKMPPENLIVIYDDVDLAAGQIRIRKKGGAGTHNGMRSILYQLQTEDFARIRIGVGQSGAMEIGDYVLSGFRKDEKKVMEDAIRRAAEAVEAIFEAGIEKAMGLYNVRPKTEAENADGESKI